MKPYSLEKQDKIRTSEFPREARKMAARKKVQERRDRRKADRKALKDEYDF